MIQLRIVFYEVLEASHDFEVEWAELYLGHSISNLLLSQGHILVLQ